MGKEKSKIIPECLTCNGEGVFRKISKNSHKVCMNLKPTRPCPLKGKTTKD